MKTLASPLRRRAVLALVLLLGLPAGYYVLRYQAWAAYRDWSIGRMNRLARDFIAAGDSRNALLTVRQILRKRPNDAAAWRLGVQAAALNPTPEVLFYQRNLCRVERTTENYLALMRLAVARGAYGYAAEAMSAVAADAARLPEFHRLAAEACRHLGRDAAAKYHLLSLLSLAPGDRDAEIALAETEFALDPAALPADWAARVERLAADPAAGPRARILQLRAAVQRRDAPAARARLAALGPAPDLAARLHVLEAVAFCAPADLAARQEALQRDVAGNPAEVVQVMDFLVAHGRAAAARDWYPALPEEARRDERVRLAAGAARDALGDWAGVRELLAGPVWKTGEALRQGYLAHAYRMQGRSGDAEECWKLAVGAAGQDVAQAVRLLRNVEAWHWDEERADVWWCLFNLTGAPEVREPLIAREFRAGNTAGLNKIFARMLESDPTDEAARNNFAYTSVLLGTNPGRALLLAEELHRAHPANATYRATYALALCRQQRFAEARELLASLDPAARARAGAMLPAALAAAGTGDDARAAGLFDALARASMLPEERALADTAQTALAARIAARADERSASPPDGAAPAAGGWLALLPDGGRSAPAEARRADAEYRRGDLAALARRLEAGRWPEAEHLRQALRAYVARRRDGAAAGLAGWRQALAAAGRDPARLRELEALCAGWDWPDERAEAMDRRFEREPGNTALLAALADYYRRAARTADLARVFWLNAAQQDAPGAGAAWCVYYSLLCGSNLSAAQTLAARAYAAAPGDPRRRAAYAFSLWRQGRPGEALALLQDPAVQQLTDMQVGLVEAGVLLELGRVADARARLERCTGVPAMPEEAALAETLRRRVAGGAPAMAMNGA
jgi:hypothetical protein